MPLVVGVVLDGADGADAGVGRRRCAGRRTPARRSSTAVRTRRVVGDVGLDRERAVRRARGVPVEDGDPGAPGEQLPGDGGADARGAAGDQRPPAPRSRRCSAVVIGVCGRPPCGGVRCGPARRARPGSGARRSTRAAYGRRSPARAGRRSGPSSITAGVGEVFVEVVDVLDDPVLPAAGHGHVVEHGQVLDEFAQSYPARVRADRNAVLGGEQQDREVLVDPGDAGRVDLDEVDGPGLEQLFEDDAVGDVLAGGDLDGLSGRVRRRGRGCRRGWWAPRSSTARTGRGPPSSAAPRRRPSAGWRPRRCGCPGRPPHGRACSRRTSSSRSAPTFSLICPNPSATACLASRTSLSSE